MEKNKWLIFLQRINFSVMMILSILIISTFFLPFEENWRFLPIFKFQILAPDKFIEIFVHAFIFDFNLGFYFQLFVLVFSFMIFFSTKRNISFHMMYVLLILRSILILMQNTTPPNNYISKDGNQTIISIHLFYIVFFGLLFALNLIFDTKKRPRHSEPYDIIKD